jgi:hypothetical protein
MSEARILGTGLILLLIHCFTTDRNLMASSYCLCLLGDKKNSNWSLSQINYYSPKKVLTAQGGVLLAELDELQEARCRVGGLLLDKGHTHVKWKDYGTLPF